MTALRQLIETAKDFRPTSQVNDWPAPLDLVALSTQEPVAPAHIMLGLPCGYVTGTFAHGGTGKSQIELMRAICIAAGIPFCGIEVQRRRVGFVSCEDRTDILHWRIKRICAHLGVELASLEGWLYLFDLVSHDSILFAPDARLGNALTPAYGKIAERIRDFQIQVLFLDGISDTFGGNEIARAEIKRFINYLIALVPADGAVHLIGHINKVSATSGSTIEGYSGSTGWHNSLRARWFLYPKSDDDGRTGELILELQKSNHGAIGTQIEFRWDEAAHLFVGKLVTGTTDFDQRHRDREEQKAILKAFKACSISTPAIIVPAATTGQRTAFNVLAQRPEFPKTLLAGKAGLRRFWRQIESLRQLHWIEEASYRRTNRHLTATLSLTTEGMRQCAE